MIDKNTNTADTAVRQLHAGDRAVNVRLAEAQKRVETDVKQQKPDPDYINSHRFMK